MIPVSPPSRADPSAVLKSSACLWIVVVLGGALRLYGLEFQSLWHDEGLQYHVAANNSFGELFDQTRSFHPPLSFMVNHLFLMLGGSDFFLRLPSALFGIASLPVLYVVAKEVTSEREALCAVFVLAISPFHVWYSQEARMYSQLLFLSLLSTMLLLQALREGKARWWILYVLVGAAGMYSHIFMGLALAAQFLWVLLFQRRYMLFITISGLAVLLLFLPWAFILPFVGRFARSVSSAGLTVAPASAGRAGFTVAAVPYTFFVYSAGFSLGPTVAELHGNRSLQFLLGFLPSILTVLGVFGALASAGVVVMYKRFGIRSLVFLLLGLAVPLAGAVVYSLTPRGTFNARYTVIAFPYFCILIGTSLAYISSRKKILGAGAMVAVVGISSVSLYNHFADPRYAKEDVRSAVRFWRQEATAEPLLAIGSTWPAKRYAGVSTAERLFFVGGKDIVAAIDRVLAAQQSSSAFVVLSRDWNQTREIAIRNAFRGAQERSYPGVKVFKIHRQAARRISESRNS